MSIVIGNLQEDQQNRIYSEFINKLGRRYLGGFAKSMEQHEMDEVIQKSAIQIWLKSATIEVNGAPMKSYFRQTVAWNRMNAFKARVRREGQYEQFDYEMPYVDSETTTDRLDEFIYEDFRALADEFISKLPQRDADLIKYLQEGKSKKEICELLSISDTFYPTQIKRLKQRLFKHIREADRAFSEVAASSGDATSFFKKNQKKVVSKCEV